MIDDIKILIENVSKNVKNFFSSLPSADSSSSSSSSSTKQEGTSPLDLTYEKKTFVDFKPGEIDNEIKKLTAGETGIDRIKELFKYDETLGKRPDFLTDNANIVTSVGIFGFILGSVLKTNQTTDNFKQNNQLTVYTSKREATTLKGGARIASRFVLFSGIILGSSTLIQAYRNKSNPLDYTAGGMLSGGILRMHKGLNNLVAGCVVGALFGSIFGIARYTQLKLTNTTYEDMRHEYLSHKIIQKKILLASIESIGTNDNKQQK